MSLANLRKAKGTGEIMCPICSPEPGFPGSGRCENCRGTGLNCAFFFEAIKEFGPRNKFCPSCLGKRLCIFCGGKGWVNLREKNPWYRL